MNIIMIHPHDLFHPAEPWTRRILHIAESMVHKGHRVKLVYFPLLLDSSLEPFTKAGVEYIPLKRDLSPLQMVRTIRVLCGLARWAQVVHLQKCHPYASVPAVIACYMTGKPLHYDWDDWEEKIWLESCGRRWHSLFIGLSFRVLEYMLPRIADSVSCASRHLLYLAARRGADVRLLKDAPVGVDTTIFSERVDGQSIRKRHGLKDHAKIVLYLGQLHGAQYVDLVIRAADEVLRQHPHEDVRFMIVGEGYLKDALIAMVRRLGLTRSFIFTGSVPREEVPLYIAAADICVAPFKKTDVTICKSPLKVVEYMSCGKYIVASAVGEVVEMMGGCGYVAQEGSYEDLAQGICYFIEHGDDAFLRQEIQERLRQRIAYKYNWEYTVNNLLNLYKKIDTTVAAQ